MTRARFVTIVTAAILFAAAPIATAHPAGDHYRIHWPDGAGVAYSFAPSYPTGAFEGRAIDGAAQWNSVAGTAEPRFVNGGRASGELPWNHCVSGFSAANQLHYLDLDSIARAPSV